MLTEEQLEKLNNIYGEWGFRGNLLLRPEVFLDKKLSQLLERELKQLEPIAKKTYEYNNQGCWLEDLEQLLLTSTDDEKKSIEEEIASIKLSREKLELELTQMLIKYDAIYGSITVEIVGTNTSVRNPKGLMKLIFDGYVAVCKFADLEYKTEYGSSFTTATIDISGLNVKEYFGNEVGIHINEATNESCQVYVYDRYANNSVSFDDFDNITFKEDEISISVCRSSGAGGQHVNTTDSAIKITHLKTGITATCQSERSQIQNREKALENLKEKVMDYYNKSKDKHIAEQKKEQVKLMQSNYIVKKYHNDIKFIAPTQRKGFYFKEFLSGQYI